MRTIRCELDRELEYVNVHVFADLHLGDERNDLMGVTQRLNDVADDPNAYIVLAGDLMNNAVRSGKSDIYGDWTTPMGQLHTLVSLFGPVKDRILCAVPGNHEERTYREDGLDPTALLMAQFSLSDRYSPDAALLFLRFGSQQRRANEKRKMTYSLYVNHGCFGGRRVGSKLNGLSDFAAIVDADVYICAHSHLPACFKESFARVYQNDCSVKYVDKVFVNSGASLDYGGYASRAGYRPASKAQPVIYLSGTRRDISVHI